VVEKDFESLEVINWRILIPRRDKWREIAAIAAKTLVLSIVETIRRRRLN